MIFLSLINLVNLDAYTTNIGLEFDTINLHPVHDPPPNVFHIILDGYSGSSSLKKFYGFNNSEFLNELEERGLNVITDSKSNYGGTYTSLPSLLNILRLKLFFIICLIRNCYQTSHFSYQILQELFEVLFFPDYL